MNELPDLSPEQSLQLEQDLLASYAHGYLTRCRDMLEHHCAGYIVVNSPRLDALYGASRRSLKKALTQLAATPTGDVQALDIDELMSYLPVSLSEVDAIYVNAEDITSLADIAIARYMQWCDRADIDAFGLNAVEFTSAFAFNDLDKLINEYVESKEEATHQWFKQHGIKWPDTQVRASESKPKDPPTKNRNQLRKAENIKRAQELDAEGLTRKEIAHKLGVHERTVYNYLTDSKS